MSADLSQLDDLIFGEINFTEMAREYVEQRNSFENTTIKVFDLIVPDQSPTYA